MHSTRTHARTHTPRWRSRCSMGRCRPTVTARSAGDNDRRCFIQTNTCEGYPVSPTFCVFFAYKKITNSLRRLPRLSSKNCDLQFANSDRFKENYSIDTSVCQCTHARACTRTHTRLEHASFTHMTSLLHLFF